MHAPTNFRLLVTGLLAGLVINGGVSRAADAITYPTTRTVEQRDTYHGVEIPDPYRWLEVHASPEVSAWAAAQNSLAEAFAGEEATSAIAQRIQHYSAFVYENRFQVFGGRTFFTRGWPGSPHAGLYVREAEGTERHLAGPLIPRDATASDAREQQARAVRNFWPSPDGERVLILEATQGDSFGSLRLVDVRSGRLLAIVSGDTHNGMTSAAWLPDGSRFAYTQTDRQGERTPVGNRTVLYAIDGGEQTIAIPPIEDLPGRNLVQTVHAAIDRPRLIVELTTGASGSNEVRLLDLDTPHPTVKKLFASGARWLLVGARGDDAWFITDSDAPRGRVVKAAGLGSGSPRLSTLVPQARGAIAAGSLVGGNAYGLFGDHLVLLFQDPEGPVIRAFATSGRRVWERPVPPSGSVWGDFTGDPRGSVFFYQFLGVGDPSTTYRVDLHRRRESVHAAPALPFAPGSFVAERLTVRGKGGVDIPLLVAHRKGLALDRPRNLILYGYGAFGWNSFLWYQPWLAEWFLAHDGIFAVAGVRGGGEHGEAWHEAGRRRHRQNAIDDYIAAAEDLIRRGLTDRSRLTANSSSLAGNLAATAVEQRPELFGAALIDYAVLELLRYLEFGQARSWLEEIGDPADPADFGPLRSISPYHNVDPEACYPPILVRPGEHDPIVTPVHSYKWVARLQAIGASKRRCQKVALLDVLEGAGHDYGSTPAEIARAHAVALAFLDRVLPGPSPPIP